MYAFSIDKKIDYSIPIIFKPQLHYIAPSFAKAMENRPGTPSKIETKTVAQKTTATKPPAPKTVAKPIKNELAKATTTATPLATSVIKKQEEKAKDEKKVIPTETIKSITPEKPVVIEKVETAQKLEPAKAQAIANKQKQEAAPINAQVSNNFREVEALRRGAQLQKELVQKWQPPIGVSPDCNCDISFFVNKQGTIENLKMVKSSGVMMFDISARQALFAMKMPQWTYGKPLIINFKQ